MWYHQGPRGSFWNNWRGGEGARQEADFCKDLLNPRLCSSNSPHCLLKEAELICSINNYQVIIMFQVVLGTEKPEDRHKSLPSGSLSSIGMDRICDVQVITSQIRLSAGCLCSSWVFYQKQVHKRGVAPVH